LLPRSTFPALYPVLAPERPPGWLGGNACSGIRYQPRSLRRSSPPGLQDPPDRSPHPAAKPLRPNRKNVA
jgi:hypothetical protein